MRTPNAKLCPAFALDGAGLDRWTPNRDERETGGGGRLCPGDLLVMSQASYWLLHPAERDVTSLNSRWKPHFPRLPAYARAFPVRRVRGGGRTAAPNGR